MLRNVCRAIICSIVSEELRRKLNFVEVNDTDQGIINEIYSVLEYLNSIHMKAWMDNYANEKISSRIKIITYKEYLNNYSIWIDGKKLKIRKVFFILIDRTIMENVLKQLIEERHMPNVLKEKKLDHKVSLEITTYK